MADWDFATKGFTSVDAGKTKVEEVAGTYTNYKGFQVMGCTVNSFSMSCLNWLVSSTGEAYFAEGATHAQGGHKRFASGDAVKFWWFDARDISDAAVYPEASNDKIKSAEVTLLMSATTGATESHIMSGLASIALAAATLLF